MRTSNPALNPNIFSDAAQGAFRGNSSEVMTVDGAVNKTGILSLILILAAGYVWSLAFSTAGYDGAPAVASNPGMLQPWILGGGLGGFVLALVTIFKKEWAPYSAPAYALLEGVFIGGLSAFFELRFPGIVMQASMLTVGTLVTMLMAYKAGVIKATEKFRSGVVMATGGIAFMYIMSLILGFFGVNLPFLHGNGMISIGISAVILVVAALNLILDFDLIEQGARAQAPKYMEWYSAFSLMVTLIWLYLEFLRLLSKINSRD